MIARWMLYNVPSHWFEEPHLGLVGAEDAGVQRSLCQLLEYARAIHRRCVTGECAVAHGRIRRPATTQTTSLNTLDSSLAPW